MKLAFFIFLYVLFYNNLYAQFKTRVIIDPESPGIEFFKTNKLKKEYNNEKEINHALKDLMIQAYKNGFLGMSIDSIMSDSAEYKVYIRLGKQYSWIDLKNGNIDESLLNSIGYRDRSFHSKIIDPFKFSDLIEKILVYCENNGFPFANIKLDSVQFHKDSVLATLDLHKERLIKVDSIRLLGDVAISPTYIYNYIGIKPGDLYNESQVLKISQRIRELPFLIEKESVKVIFTEKHTKIFLSLLKRKSSNFNGIIGFMPDEQTGKMLITGEARIKLLNSLHHGETIDFNWRKLQSKTQDLKTGFVYPFFFNTPFGLDMTIKLYRRDTLYSNVNKELGIQYLLKGGNYFKVFVSQDNSNLISTSGLATTTTLPSYADISTISYGLGLRLDKLDYRLNPRKGVSLDLTGSLGNKLIKKNPNINAEVYDSLQLKSVQYRGIADIDLFIPLLKRTTLNVGVQSSWIYDESLFENELYRFGGLHTLRGFDEESINASLFSIFSLEYRYLLEQNSYAYIFGNAAYYENTSIGNRIFDQPIGFGAGISFETKTGIFSISYALGKQFENPILFKTAKIHFGFVNYF